MICGALQTLNEDAFEDVASSERPSPSGLPTGEMLAAAAQLHLAPIRESSEFGSPSDEQKINIDLLPFVSNNNNNNSNNYNTPQQNKNSTTTDYNRSASSNSLYSLSGGMNMGNGINSTITNNSNSGSGGGVGSGGISLVMSSNNLRHSIIGDGGNLLSASNIGGRGLTQRHHSVGDDLLCEPMTPQLRGQSHSTGIPTVVVIPNSNDDYSTHHIVDDTKL